MRHWASIAATLVLLTPPALAVARPLPDVDYPPNALKEGREGTTHYTVTVGTNGRAKDCRITESSGSKDLDDATCDMIMKSGRFKPAKDASGQPVESSLSGGMAWHLPH